VGFFQVILWSMVSFSFFLNASEPQEDAVRQAIEKAIDRVKPALVQIMVVAKGYYEGREHKGESSGSGVIISKEGYVVTNHHVAGHSSRLICILSNKEEIEADLVGTDAMSDIAVLRLRPKNPREFPFANFGDSSLLKVGDRVLAMGSPRSLSQSVTLGIVSNVEMIAPRLSKNMRFQLDGEDVGGLVKWIGHDAAIYPGNSGGPLVNLRGEVIGINEIGMGLGGAIPSNLARHIAEDLLEYGQVRRAYLGLQVQRQMKSNLLRKGVLISGTFSDSPAAKAGFQSGDILLQLDGQDTNIRYEEELPIFNQFLMDLEIAREIEAVLLRNKQMLVLKVTPVERETVLSKEMELTSWGATVSNLSLWQMKVLKRPDTKGVYVTSIRPGGPCGEAKPSLQAGDLIISVQDQAVEYAEALRHESEGILRKNNGSAVHVLVRFIRNNQEYLTAVKIGPQDVKDPGSEVKKAWLPVTTQVLTAEIAKLLGLAGKKGVRVTFVYPKSSAEKAGLQVGDILTALDDEALEVEQPEDNEVFTNRIRQYKIGSTAQITLLRGREEKKLSVELVQSPRLSREMRKYYNHFFEFGVREMEYLDQVDKDLNTEQVQGVLVTEVKSGGWAALANVLGNDILLKVNGETIQNLDHFKTLMEQVEERRPTTIVFHVLRGISYYFIEMEPEWNS
jgi:serine protease Do